MAIDRFREQIGASWSEAVRRFWASETAVMVVFAVVVGVGIGLGTVLFIHMIQWAQTLFFDGGGKVFAFLGRPYVILIPVIGGLLVGPLVYYVAPEAKGHGVPEVMTAIATNRGRIRPVVVLAKALGSAITIGSGGSIWRGGRVVIPRGNTQRYAGDRLIVFTRENDQETLQTVIRCCQDDGEKVH